MVPKSRENKIYIPKSNPHLVDALATKRYLSLLLEDTMHDKKLLDSYITQYNSHTRLADNFAISPLYSKHISHSSLISPDSLPQNVQNWLNIPFVSNPKHPEALIHDSISGHKLRSKSEVMIDTMLYLSNIPYKYEAPLMLNGIAFYPDFTLYRAATGQQVYWDHFGLMDQPQYRNSFINKLQTYTSNGLIPNINLIMTFETSGNPLTSVQVQNMISLFLLETPQTF